MPTFVRIRLSLLGTPMLPIRRDATRPHDVLWREFTERRPRWSQPFRSPINIQRRLVYEVLPDWQVMHVPRVWTRYECPVWACPPATKASATGPGAPPIQRDGGNTSTCSGAQTEMSQSSPTPD